MDLFTGLIYSFIVALAYGVGEFVGTRKREREIAAKIVDNMLKELQQDHVLEMIGNDIFAGTKKRGDKNAKH